MRSTCPSMGRALRRSPDASALFVCRVAWKDRATDKNCRSRSRELVSVVSNTYGTLNMANFRVVKRLTHMALDTGEANNL